MIVTDNLSAALALYFYLEKCYIGKNCTGVVGMEHGMIQAFCDNWIAKFTDESTNYLELIERHMGDECAALGFEMDCGHAFTEQYGEAATNIHALEKIISQVDNIPLLGSAIFSNGDISPTGPIVVRKYWNRKTGRGSSQPLHD